MRPPGFPFPALVGLDALKMALQLAAVDRRLSLLIRGDKGAGKSTAARGLAELLEDGAPFVNLPIGATDDRLLVQVQNNGRAGAVLHMTIPEGPGVLVRDIEYSVSGSRSLTDSGSASTPTAALAGHARLAGTVRDDGEPIHDMRSSWRRLLLGLIPLLAVTAAAILLERGSIEKDLAERFGVTQRTVRNRLAVALGRLGLSEPETAAERSVAMTGPEHSLASPGPRNGLSAGSGEVAVPSKVWASGWVQNGRRFV